MIGFVTYFPAYSTSYEFWDTFMAIRIFVVGIYVTRAHRIWIPRDFLSLAHFRSFTYPSHGLRVQRKTLFWILVVKI